MGTKESLDALKNAWKESDNEQKNINKTMTLLTLALALGSFIQAISLINDFIKTENKTVLDIAVAIILAVALFAMLSIIMKVLEKNPDALKNK